MPPIKGELGSKLGALGLEGRDLGVSPVMILHSFSGGRYTHVVNIRFKCRVGTSCKALEARATLCPPGTFPPSVSMVDIRSIMDLQNSSSASAMPVEVLSKPSLSLQGLDSGLYCSTSVS